MRGSWGLVVALGGCELVFPVDGAGDDGAGADAPAADAPGTDASLDRTDGSVDAGPPPPPPDALATSDCPADYGTFGQTHRYRPVLAFATFIAAAGDCADDHIPGSTQYTHLVVLDDDLERSLVDATFQLPVAWIGLSDARAETEWRWVTLQATAGYPPPPPGGPWATNQPDDGGNAMNEDCGFIANPGAVLGDAFCDLSLRYVCECDAHMNVPAQYLPP